MTESPAGDSVTCSRRQSKSATTGSRVWHMRYQTRDCNWGSRRQSKSATADVSSRCHRSRRLLICDRVTNTVLSQQPSRMKHLGCIPVGDIISWVLRTQDKIWVPLTYSGQDWVLRSNTQSSLECSALKTPSLEFKLKPENRSVLSANHSRLRLSLLGVKGAKRGTLSLG